MKLEVKRICVLCIMAGVHICKLIKREWNQTSFKNSSIYFVVFFIIVNPVNEFFEFLNGQKFIFHVALYIKFIEIQ